MSRQETLPRMRVAVTRDEADDGALHAALRDLGFDPVTCVVLEQHPPADTAALKAAVDSL